MSWTQTDTHTKGTRSETHWLQKGLEEGGKGDEVHVPKLANLLSVHCIGINLPICIIVDQVSLRNCNRTVSVSGHVPVPIPDTPRTTHVYFPEAACSREDETKGRKICSSKLPPALLRSDNSTLKCILQDYQTVIGVTQFNWTQEICITKHCAAPTKSETGTLKGNRNRKLEQRLAR